MPSYEGKGLSADDAKAAADDFKKRMGAALKAAGYPEKADPAAIDKPKAIAILTAPDLAGVHGLCADGGGPGRDVPDPHPLQLDERALPLRQRLVRRPAASHRLHHHGDDRRHVRRSVVSDRRGGR
ncbi:MAG: hypothetical protein WDN06_11240 [Asticcacaulis sp.]